MTVLFLRVCAATLFCAVGCCPPCKKDTKGDEDASAASVEPIASASEVSLGPGDDTPPERWSSPAESKAAAPSWSKVLWYAPQVPVKLAEEWFEAGSQTPFPESEESMAVCRVHYAGDPDQGLNAAFRSNAPDLSVRVKLPGDLSLHAAGPEDNHSMLVTVPLLARGALATIELSLIDRDPLGWDDLDTLKVPMPPRGEAREGQSSATCLLVPREVVEGEVRRMCSNADVKLESQGKALSANLSHQMLGSLGLGSDLEKAIEPLASLVGWADPRVRRRVAWATRILAKQRQLCAEIAAREAPLRQRTTSMEHRWRRWKFEVAGWDCGDEVTKRFPPIGLARDGPTGCVVAVRASHDGDKPGDLHDFHNSLNGELVHADGEVTALWAVATFPSDGFAPGKTGTVVYAMAAKDSPWEREPGRKPLLFILRPGLSEPAVMNAEGLGRWAGP
jgi:hypothetical protein